MQLANWTSLFAHKSLGFSHAMFWTILCFYMLNLFFWAELRILDFLKQCKLKNSIFFSFDTRKLYYGINEVFVIQIFCLEQKHI